GLQPELPLWKPHQQVGSARLEPKQPQFQSRFVTSSKKLRAKPGAGDWGYGRERPSILNCSCSVCTRKWDPFSGPGCSFVRVRNLTLERSPISSPLIWKESIGSRGRQLVETGRLTWEQARHSPSFTRVTLPVETLISATS